MEIGEQETLHLSISWVDLRREVFKTEAESYDFVGGFLCIILPESVRRPEVTTKTLCFPAHTIMSVQAETMKPSEPKGYREENSFREVPGSAPVTRGVGR